MGEFAVFIPILIFLIPVLAVTFSGLTKLARAKAEQQGALGGEALERITELESAMQHVQQQLSETQERLDFAERMLAKPKDRV
jgi:ABC-type multidrug transport system fused ATPase/permease subunit